MRTSVRFPLLVLLALFLCLCGIASSQTVESVLNGIQDRKYMVELRAVVESELEDEDPPLTLSQADLIDWPNIGEEDGRPEDGEIGALTLPELVEVLNEAAYQLEVLKGHYLVASSYRDNSGTGRELVSLNLPPVGRVDESNWRGALVEMGSQLNRMNSLLWPAKYSRYLYFAEEKDEDAFDPAMVPEFAMLEDQGPVAPEDLVTAAPHIAHNVFYSGRGTEEGAGGYPPAFTEVVTTGSFTSTLETKLSADGGLAPGADPYPDAGEIALYRAMLPPSLPAGGNNCCNGGGSASTRDSRALMQLILDQYIGETPAPPDPLNPPTQALGAGWTRVETASVAAGGTVTLGTASPGSAGANAVEGQARELLKLGPDGAPAPAAPSGAGWVDAVDMYGTTDGKTHTFSDDPDMVFHATEGGDPCCTVGTGEEYNIAVQVIATPAFDPVDLRDGKYLGGPGAPGEVGVGPGGDIVRIHLGRGTGDFTRRGYLTCRTDGFGSVYFSGPDTGFTIEYAAHSGDFTDTAVDGKPEFDYDLDDEFTQTQIDASGFESRLQCLMAWHQPRITQVEGHDIRAEITYGQASYKTTVELFRTGGATPFKTVVIDNPAQAGNTLPTEPGRVRVLEEIDGLQDFYRTSRIVESPSGSQVDYTFKAGTAAIPTEYSHTVNLDPGGPGAEAVESIQTVFNGVTDDLTNKYRPGRTSFSNFPLPTRFTKTVGSTSRSVAIEYHPETAGSGEPERGLLKRITWEDDPNWSLDGDEANYSVRGLFENRKSKGWGDQPVEVVAIWSGSKRTTKTKIGTDVITEVDTTWSQPGFTKVVTEMKGGLIGSSEANYHDGSATLPHSLDTSTGNTFGSSPDVTHTHAVSPDGSLVAGTTDTGGLGTVTTTSLNGLGGLVFRTTAVGGTTTSLVTGSGHNARGRPGQLVTIAGGRSTVEDFTYHADGAVHTHKVTPPSGPADAVTDTYKIDPFGRLDTGTMIDGIGLTPTYNGLSTSVDYGGRTLDTSVDGFGRLTGRSSDSGYGSDLDPSAPGPGGTRDTDLAIPGQNRSATASLHGDGLPEEISGGLGTPGTEFAYTVVAVNGVNCLAVESVPAVSASPGAGSKPDAAVTEYRDGQGRLRRIRSPHPDKDQAGQFVTTGYAYDLGTRTITVTPPEGTLPTTITYTPDWLTATLTQGARTRVIGTSQVGDELVRLGTGTGEDTENRIDLADGSTRTEQGGRLVGTTANLPGGGVLVTDRHGNTLETDPGKTRATATLDIDGVETVAGVDKNGFGEATGIDVDGSAPGGLGDLDIDLEPDTGEITGGTVAGSPLVNPSVTWTGGRREGSVTWRGEEHGSGSGPLGGDLSETSDNWGGWTSQGHPLDGSVTVTRPDGVSLDLGFSAGGVFSGLTRGDGSGFSLKRHGTGRVDLVTRFDAFGSHVTDLHFDQNLGASTGFTATGPGSPATDITCVVVPVDSGTYLGRPWQVDFTSPGPPGSGPVSVFTEYTYFAGEPATETHAGLLAGFEVERLRNATTGDTEYVALRRDGQVVHQVAYGYSTGGRLVDFTTSVSADLTSGYGYLAGTRWIETLTRDTAPGGTATPVVETRVPEAGGRLGSISTAGASGTYASAYTYLGHRRDSLARSFPAAGSEPAAIWNWDYAYALRGQLQTADSNQGHNHDYQHDAMGDRAAGAANPANQYSVLHIPGTRAFRLEGTAAPGSTLVAERPGEPPLPLVQQPDGTFSAILPVDPAFPDDQIAVGEVTVTGTRPGEGDGGGDAVAKLVRTAVSPPSAAPLAYGAHGAVAQDWRWDYSWNVLGRLGRMETRAEATAAGLPNLTLHFNYDHRGRRVLKTVEHKDAAGAVQRTVTTRFLHDGWDLLGEFTTDTDQPGTETQRYYTWGLDIDGTRDGAGGVGGLVAIHQDGATYLPVHDGTGNIVALLDDTGSELARWHRGPFGEPLASSGQTHLCPFGFATHYTDTETGLVYFGMRYYSPAQGRWLSREPLGEFESQNLYAYAGNDPVNKTDYLGAATISAGGGTAGKFHSLGTWRVHRNVGQSSGHVIR